VQKTYFEMDMIIHDKKHEVKFDAAGNIEDEQSTVTPCLNWASSDCPIFSNPLRTRVSFIA